ncbi:MAG: hypothetical protein KA270_04920 [Saprospiraceae bacterium]|jgi:hypothetical protein|nr:hypothetical protein [Saprospiraceae bacterium]MBP6237726.1 hypothetical protein [Saprospiraceae bacterium]MBP6566487.1 hypothetical protein [Saprospiraceae bacterium]MBP9196060.1 hypothetical protein [Saprospiraceae bacterium]
MDIITSRFVKVGIINLIIVATIGVLMRYKIGFEFPYFDQKHLLHAHSHFAFSGWVTHTLFTLMVLFLKKQKNIMFNTQKYNVLIIFNLLCAYGMLFAFAMQGYGFVSISFSTISILLGYVYAWFYIGDLKKIPSDHPSKNWFKAALFFNVLSSLGTFYLAYMMATKHIHQHAYLGSVYFYLHFQYSGWFFFAIMGLLMSKLVLASDFKNDSFIFNTLALATIPAFILSVLWLKLPWYVYIFPVFAVILQLYGLFRLMNLFVKHYYHIKTTWIKPVRIIFGLSFLALSIKFLLQTGSIFPEISKLAFGFRSIVIAYLHLVLLAITTLFLLGFMLLQGYIHQVKLAFTGLILFSIGVFANELVLMVQGIASFGYFLIPYLNEILLGVSIFMLLSLVLILISYLHKTNIYHQK